MASILLIGSKGYIGSRLQSCLEDGGHFVVGWDSDILKLRPRVSFDCDFNRLSEDYIQEYDTVILLAGHSSVPMCSNDEFGAWKNNVENFKGLLDKLRPDQQFIYASSGSVYGQGLQVHEDAALPLPMNMYDLTKQTIDKLARLSGKRAYGLRFGTVCGRSSNPRNELLINSMVCDGHNQGRVFVSNHNALRAVLGMSDLCSAICSMLEQPEAPPGVYNLSSFSEDIGSISLKVASKMGAEVVPLPPSRTYSFSFQAWKFQDTFKWRPECTVESIVDELLEQPARLDKSYNRSTNLVKY